ncbi:MAG: adenylate synthase [Acidobacteria bacterium]|nr:adenylate synthase [Acidobacteriota bacterium]
MREIGAAIGTFARARWGLRFLDRDHLLQWQQRRIEHFLRDHLRRASFYRDFGGARLDQLPIVDKPAVLADFAAFNTCGISLDRAVDIALAAEWDRNFRPTLDGLTVGLSSGTSGTRGVFIVNAEERQRWAGLVLARLLTTASLRQIAQPWRPALRIAFFLRANSNLYETVASRRLQFAFHDLTEPLGGHVQRLNGASPHVLVAPPTVLRSLAAAALGGELRIAPAQVVSVAEVIEPDDRVEIERAFGVPLQEVYQATEGFLGVSCPAGRLHLNEEFLHIEPEWLDGEHRRFRPIVTDFTRTSQLVVRYRLDDVLRDAEGPCTCGRVTRSLDAVEGRSDDVLWWPSRIDRAPRQVFPDTVRRAMVLVSASVRDYRIEQRGQAWHVRIDADSADADSAQRAARREIEGLCSGLGLEPPVLRFEPWIEPPPLEKRRRIRCVDRPIAAEARA